MGGCDDSRSKRSSRSSVVQDAQYKQVVASAVSAVARTQYLESVDKYQAMHGMDDFYMLMTDPDPIRATQVCLTLVQQGRSIQACGTRLWSWNCTAPRGHPP